MPLKKYSKNLIAVKDAEGRIQFYLNPSLIEKQNLSSNQIKIIKNLHANLLQIKQTMRDNINNPSMLRELFNLTSQVEFNLQLRWGFPINWKMTNWFYVPGCECPKLDNHEAKPYRQIINCECPIHGHETFFDEMDTKELEFKQRLTLLGGNRAK